MSTPEPPENPEQPEAAQPSAEPPPAQEAPPTGQPVAVAPAQSESDDRMMGVLIWILGLFFSIIGPLIVWLIRRDQSPFVDSVGKTVLNFNISYTIWIIVTAVLSIILIGIPFLIAAGVMYFVFSIVGAVKANQGEDFTPWLTIRFLK
jgi:uncharacterized Tic20 family protein